MTRDKREAPPLFDLFRIEVENQAQQLTAGLLALEQSPGAADQLEICMRAAHSLKGASRIVGLNASVSIAHVMEDCFVAAQRGERSLTRSLVDILLRGVDWLRRIAQLPEAEAKRWSDANAELEQYLAALRARIAQKEDDVAPITPSAAVAAEPEINKQKSDDRVLRVTAENLDRLLGLAGESLVGAKFLKPFTDSLQRLKHLLHESHKAIENVNQALPQQTAGEQTQTLLVDAQQHVVACQQLLARQLAEFEKFTLRTNDASQRLYEEALASRMRPFADGVGGYPRMVRDIGHALGKAVKLDIGGLATQVDRDILEKLDAPLNHLLRNAIDHGIETPTQRVAAGKPTEATIRLEAHHSAGMLQVSVSDDGRGIDLDRLRSRIVERQLTNAETATRLSEAELLEFLFLPGFTLKDDISEISGRGVGLDVVQHMVKQVRGTIRIFTEAGRGARFQLQLPLTLSVVRALLVEIGGEPYAFPLAHIGRALKLAPENIAQLEGRQHFNLGEKQIGLVTAHQVLRKDQPALVGDLSVIIVGEANHPYGLIVDRLLGEHELVVQPLDLRLGKIKDIAAAALMDDGTPLLIVDVDDIVRSVEKLAAEGTLDRARGDGLGAQAKQRKRVLVVDDSFVVRELERKLLDNRGYDVEIAVDGMDGWNAVRIGHFDLIITDVDMPRLDGVELVQLIKRDPNLKSLPVMIVSYKDREEDRRRGLEAGADYYLTKGSFHDERLIDAVVDLIGEAAA